MSLYEVLSLILGILGAVVIIVQLSIAIRAMRADHERRQKQATIEHVRTIRPLYKHCRQVIDEKFGKDVLSDGAVGEIDKDDELRENIKDMLALLEHTSVGMNTGVFDKDLWYRMSASYLIRIYHRLRPYIKYIQKSQPSAYIEFEEIVHEFEERKRRRPDSRGQIKYS